MDTREEKPDGELWIGLAEVTQTSNPGVLGTSAGAFTNAIARAVSRNSFRSTVKDAVTALGLRLTRLESAETLTARLAEYSLDAELTKVAEEANKTGCVEFGTFHAFGGNEVPETPASFIRE
jgi:hypothetical protein